MKLNEHILKTCINGVQKYETTLKNWLGVIKVSMKCKSIFYMHVIISNF